MTKHKNRPLEEHSASHRRMLASFFDTNDHFWTNYQKRAEIIWEGKHYVLIRTGVDDSLFRYVFMADRLGLLITEDSGPLEQLAAALHPVQTERATKEAVTLHDSDQSEDNTGIFKGRWCKTRLKECIDYVKRQEAAYGDELPLWIEDWKRRQHEAEGLKQEERDCAADLLRFARQKLGREVRPARSWEKKGRFCERRASFKTGTVKFALSDEDWRIDLRFLNSMRLTVDQFKQLFSLLGQFDKETGELPDDETD